MSPDVVQWSERIERGLVHVSTITRLEVGYSARSRDQLDAIMGSAPMSRLILESLTPEVELRALEVQRTLCARGLHRAPSVPDLLIAATAELVGLSVLHVDKDFELIASVTGQDVERLLLPV